MSEITSRNGKIVGYLVGIVVVSVLVAAVVAGPVAAHTGDDGLHHHDGWMGTHGGTGGWMVGVGGLWLLLWTLVAVAVPATLVYLLFARRDAAGGPGDDALALLRRRYAGGEIDEEEFESRRARLLAERES